MRVAVWTPEERLRPLNLAPRIEYASNGKYIVRRDFERMDPDVSIGERQFSNAFELVVSWFAVLALCGFAWWALIEGSKIVYSFAFSHPFFH